MAYREPPPEPVESTLRARVRFLAVLLVAAAPFAVLVLSAYRFAALPPSAPSLQRLGWPETAQQATVLHIVIEPDGQHAWTVLSRPQLRLVLACEFDFATARATRCERIDAQEQGVPHVGIAYGASTLALLISQPPTWPARLVTIAPNAPAHITPIVASTEMFGNGSRTLTNNIAWNDVRQRFEVYASRFAGEPGRRSYVERFAVTPAGAATEWEALAQPDALPAECVFAVPIAAIPGDPAGVVLRCNESAWVTRGQVTTRIERGACRWSSPTLCLSTASTATVDGMVVFQYAQWLDDSTGHVTELAAVPPDADRVLLAQRVSRGGELTPLFASSSRADGHITFEPSAGERVVLENHNGGGESVLSARRADGSSVALATGSGVYSGHWRMLPWTGGVTLLQFEDGRALALDRQLRAKAPGSRWANLAAIIAHRFSLDAVSTMAYLLFLLGYPVLAALGARAMQRVAARRASIPTWLTALLVAYAAAAALLIFANSGYIFPPA